MASNKNNVFVNKIIKHYLKYDKDNPFIFISSILSLLSVAAGVMVLMLAMGIMNGTQKEFKKRLFVMNYPLTLIPIGYQNVNDELISQLSKKFPEFIFSPYYITHVASKSGYGGSASQLYGVNFEQEAKINEVFKKALENSISSPSKYKLVLGETVLEESSLKHGEKLTLLFLKGETIGFGTMPTQKRFIIDATFSSGLKNYDKVLMYTTHEAFQKVLKRESHIYDGIHIYSANAMNDIERLNNYLKSINKYEGVRVQGWWEQNASFFAAMEMEKKALFLVLLLIILVAALNIISSLLMTVMSRRTEIAFMKTLGATSNEIRSIFFKLGAIIGFVGIFVGTFLGLIGMWILTTFPIIQLSEDVYGFTKLPVDLTLLDFVLIILGAIVIVMTSSIYPAKKASSTDPLKVLRNE
ncbi:MAG: Lipoprotein releasing system transmembrane protein LolC [uncultured Sulfurovum sp.]|uniref:Lipoprotein releasing system transmembrane protein LolC n=1 Tax=uncultured Sulfurovum sp. TaxID=269237 RepID=A0A6S6SE98_9BACT|nr:MAG: Lipoprotein releasing system transmembrane protein LolC [uncultured Sulfurovum sp.]